DQERRRPLQHVAERRVAGAADRALREPVLRDATAPVDLADRAAELVHLPRREAAILREHGHRRSRELAGERLDVLDLFCPFHDVLTPPRRVPHRSAPTAPWSWRPRC